MATKIESRDALIREGLKLQEIADREQVGHQAIHNYILKTGQHAIWEEKKRERRAAIGGLLSQILSVGEQLSSQVEQAGLYNASETERLAYRTTQEYFSKHVVPYSFDVILSLFHDYYDAQRHKKKIPLRTFSQKYDISLMGVSRIFSRMDLAAPAKPMIKKRKRRSSANRN